MSEAPIAYEQHHYTTIDDDNRTVRVEDDMDGIYTAVEFEVPIESQAHMPLDWTTDTWTVRFSQRFDADGNPANIDA